MERITKESLNEELNLKLQDAQKGMPTNLKVEKGDFIDQIHAIEKEIEDSDIIRKKDEEKLNTQTSIRGFYKELDASVYKAIDDSNRQIAKSLENRARRRNTLAKRKEKVEKAQQNFISDLQKRKNEIEKQIEDIENQIAKIESEREELKQLRRNHIEVYKLKVDKDVYQLINKKSREFMQSAREKKEQIKDLETQREGFESDLAILDDFMVEVRDGKKEEKIVEETTEVLETPAPEVEKTEKAEKTEKTEQVPEASTSEKEKSEEVPETTAPRTEENKQVSEPKSDNTVHTYGYGHRQRVNWTVPNQTTTVPEESIDKAAEELNSKKNEFEAYNQSDPKIVGSSEDKTESEKQTNTVELKEIKFSISKDGKPVYSATIVNGDKEEIITLDKNIHTRLNSNYAKNFERIEELDKYLDPNIAELLMKVEKTYSEVEDKDKAKAEEIINKSKIKAFDKYVVFMKGKNEGKKPAVDISYDFSELYDMPTDKDAKRRIKFIQKIAKANYNRGLLKAYEGRPSILERIKQKLSNVFARRITSGTLKSDKINPLTNDEIKELYDRESSKDDFNKVEFEKMLEENHIPLEQFKTIVPEYEPASELREGKPTEMPIESTTETPVEENKPNDFKEGLKVSQQSLNNSNPTVISGNNENEVEVENESSNHGEYGE